MSLLDINKRLLVLSESLIKEANGDVEKIRSQLNKVTQAINSGKLNNEQLARAGQIIVQLTNQLISMQ